MSCECVKKETGKGKGKVKGYIVTSLCAECEAQRAADVIAQEEQKKYEDANLLIAKKAQDMAKAELIKEGKIEEVDGKVKVK